MTTMTRTMLALVGALALGALVAACGGDGGNNGGSPDMAMTSGGGGDMATAACSMNPMTHEELLNACTTAQTGDPAKDAPYYPSLAPNGARPPLP
jgi:hypothetical protein